MRINNKRKKLLISALLGVASALVIFSMYNSMNKKLDSQDRVIVEQLQKIEDMKKSMTFSSENNASNENEYFVATHPISKGSKLKLTDFKKQKFPMKITGTITEPSLLVDKTLLVDLKQDDLITEKAVPGTQLMDDAYIPPGMRLVTIPASSIQGLASYIKIGTKVDIISIARDKNSQSEIILQNIKIVSLEPKNAEQTNIKSVSDSSAVTFIVPTQSTARLIESFTNGKIQLIARGNDDNGIITKRTTPRRIQITTSSLPNITSIPNNLPAPAVPEFKKSGAKVEMIQAGNKSEVNFE